MQLITANNGVKYFSSDKIRCPHGFSTRIGGISTEPHTKELNLQLGRGDSDSTVLANLERFAAAVGIESRSIVSAHQMHSNTVMRITDADSGKGYFKSTDFECDGFVTSEKNVAPSVKTADCVPILLSGEDGDGNVIAVSALHAGWRGTAKNIVSIGVFELFKLGITPENIFAAIGPHISANCFETDLDCRDSIISQLGASFERFIEPRKNKFHVDLGKINRQLLLSVGIPESNIDLSDACTFAFSELFYSHRRMNGVRGTMLSVISIKNNI